MRKLFILLILIMSCSNQDGPSDLMSEEQMVNFLLDINIINSSRAYRNNSDLNYYNIKDTFLYKKHNIDSLQFVNSNKYYSSNPKQYLRIYSNLQKKMRFIKDSIEIELNKETKKIMDSLSLVN
ncbi:DUF4296 domain-containing protein [Flavobacteriaceae bacterium]|jgi:hypothetical protein|nr:DUF4296 domain-containing protein [Flavobacteriaceae bacterium]MDA8938002.1 DUF4296 domain-containing protein [Flavobacteriaceae bacterium]MDA9339098.1 DUF4296 domain-containing protein [Flavobacteriaceae bacterium]MDC0116806.1 DUF4296 domain-containing protein [Flavobacteriaceae bacterium]|tara:strand:- start:341 stop:712 length:372 start_codon:yes stop_codon:yes gene_type:complete